MDFPIIILAVVIIGTVKVFNSRQDAVGSEVSSEVIAESGKVLSAVILEDIPVCGNLELRREAGAFTAIVKEMGLMQ